MWHDEPGSLTKTLPCLSELGRLQLMGGRISQLKELPWLDVASEIAGHVCIHNRTLLASCSMTLPQLGQYISDWRARISFGPCSATSTSCRQDFQGLAEHLPLGLCYVTMQTFAKEELALAALDVVRAAQPTSRLSQATGK